MTLPSIAYTNGIPNPPNNPASDVGIMQANANAISNFVSVDHVAFGTDNSGAHNQCNFITTSIGNSPTEPSTLAGEGSGVNSVTLYSSTTNEGGSFGVQPELFFIRGNDLGTQIQLTGPGTPSNAANFGISFLPGGYIIQWGKVFAGQTSSNTTNYKFNSTSPNITFPTTCFQVQLTLQQAIINGFSFGVSNLSASGFTLNTLASSYGSGGGGATFNWFAIGY